MTFSFLFIISVNCDRNKSKGFHGQSCIDYSTFGNDIEFRVKIDAEN